jgi:hypothetical protein
MKVMPSIEMAMRGVALKGRRLFIIGFTSPLDQSIASQAMFASA